MTLNDVMAVILCYRTESGMFGAHYVKVVEDRTYCLNRNVVQNLVFSNI